MSKKDKLSAGVGGKELQQQVDELKQQVEENLNGWKRAQADYQNLQNDFNKQKSSLIEFANLGLIMDLLPIYDNFLKAMEHLPVEQQASDWVIGVTHIKNQLQNLLKEKQVEPIQSVGEKFNPELHEAIGQEEHVDLEDEIIVKEIQAGYTLKNKVIRPAKVIVNQK